MIWEEILTKSKNMGWRSHHVFQEEMQKVILTCLSQEEVFNDIVFQGGTSLRLLCKSTFF